MRKVYVAVLVAVLLAANVLGVSAATFPDLEGAWAGQEAEALSAVGLMQGYGGLFHPDEWVTRAQFATLAVRALGLESQVPAAKGHTHFTDVPTSSWAVGYVNVASEAEIVKGYPGSIFKPEETVRLAEGVTMVIRLLGYEPSLGPGVWPAPQVAKAVEFGLIHGFYADAPQQAVNEWMKRNDVADLFYRALNIPLMAGGVQTDRNILTNMGCTRLEGRITGAFFLQGGALEEDQVAIDGRVLTLAAGAWFDSDYLWGYLDLPGAWPGLDVEAWVNKAGQVVYGEAQAPDYHEFGVVTAIGPESVTLRVGDLSYRGISSSEPSDVTLPLSPTALVWLNGQTHGAVTAGDADLLGAECLALAGEVDGRPQAQSLFCQRFSDSLFVTEVSTSTNRVTGINENGQSETLNLGGYDLAVILTPGGLGSVVDIVPGAVVSVYEKGTAYAWLEVAEDQSTGTLQPVSGGGGQPLVVTVGAPAEVAARATFSPDYNEAFSVLSGKSVLDPHVGKDVTVYRDRSGRIRHIAAGAPYGTVAVVKTQFTYTGSGAGKKYTVSLFAKDGTTVAAEVTAATLFDGAPFELAAIDTLGKDELDVKYPEGTLARCTICGDGRIIEFSMIRARTTTSWIHTGVYSTIYAASASEIDPVRCQLAYLTVDPGCVFIDTGAWKVYAWAEFGKYAGPSELQFQFYSDWGDYVTFSSTGQALSFTRDTLDYVGVVVNKTTVSGGVRLEVVTAGPYDEEQTTFCVVAPQTQVTALTGANQGSPSSSAADIKPGELVTLRLRDSDCLWVREAAQMDLELGGKQEVTRNATVPAFDGYWVVTKEDPDGYVVPGSALLVDSTTVPVTFGDYGEGLVGRFVQVFDLDGDGNLEAMRLVE